MAPPAPDPAPTTNTTTTLSAQAFTCYICTGLLDEPCTAPCGHTFCRVCLQKWAAAGKACPLDHRPLPKEAPAVSVHLRDMVAKLFPEAQAAGRARRDAAARLDRLLALARAALLTEGATLSDHTEAQTHAHGAYVELLRLCMARRVDLSQGAKTRVLAAALARRDRALVEYCLASEEARGLLCEHAGGDAFGFPELLKAVRLLDAPRMIRAKEARLARLQKRRRASRAVLGQLRSDLSDLRREEVAEGSLSGSLARYLRRLVRRVPAEKLGFFALQLPREPWRQLADVLHLHPQRDLRVGWFLPRAFGDCEAPEGSCFELEALAPDNALALVEAHRPAYAFLRTRLPSPAPEVRLAVARYSSLDVCLWWHHELRSPAVDALIAARLASPDEPPLEQPYGKLMELLLRLRSEPVRPPFFAALLAVAERKLAALSLPLQPPVAVFGDASSSMTVAIRTAVIVASVLRVLTEADLSFFNSRCFRTDAAAPTDAASVLDCAARTRAQGSTAPAACLWEYLRDKTVVRTFVVCTDEEENTRFEGLYFHEMMRRYRDEVFPAQVVLVSFLRPNVEGLMNRRLRDVGIEPVQFRFDARRPDLCKLDALIGLLALDTDATQAKLRALVLAQDAARQGEGGRADGPGGGAGARGMEESFVVVSVQDELADAMAS